MFSEITESYLKTITTTNSYEKALDLYQGNAVFDTFSKGDLLEGKCQGRGQSYYQVKVQLDNGLILNANCTCPYDWGGYCKHIIALLLTYIENPTAFANEVNLDSALMALDRDQLINLVKQMANHSKAVNDFIQKYLQGISAQQSWIDSEQIMPKIDYRKHIRDNFNRVTRLRMSEAYWLMPELVAELNQIQDSAIEYYNSGDIQTALEIFTTLFVEVAAQYDQVDDSDGMLGYLFNELSFYLTEVIIFADLNDERRRKLYDKLKIHVENLISYGIDEVCVILYALSDEREDIPLDEGDTTGYHQDIFTEVRLNVLERKGRTDEFLSYSLNVGAYARHILMQIELGNIEKAIQIAWNSLSNPDDVLEVAETLKQEGLLEEAICLGEKGLEMDGSHYSLGVWLAGLEKDQGRIEKAIEAYNRAFESTPTFEIYSALKQLSGTNWEELRHDLIEFLQSSNIIGLLIDIYLSESLWDPAISLADEVGQWNYNLIDKVTKAVLPYRPDWVIKASKIQAESLIGKSNRKYYRIAVRWLKKAKKAYQEIDQQHEWNLYLEGIKGTYSRRYALLEELSVFDEVNNFSS